MSWFRKSIEPQTVTCEDVVAAFGTLVERNPTATDETLLPYEPELIKAALVEVAVRNGTEEATDTAKTGFVLLNSFTGRVRKLDPLRVSGDAVHTLLDRELDTLEDEFDSRLDFARSRRDA
ncbi:MAG: hypothetical protein ACTHKM_11265 [Tsuneonella sp.]